MMNVDRKLLAEWTKLTSSDLR